MKYLGSKAKFAKDFLPVVLNNRKPGQLFVEPFCGGCNVTVKVPGLRLANDINKYVISMYKKLVQGWVPPNYISFHDYQKIKQSPDKYDPALVGFAGIACSFASNFLGTYARSDRGLSNRKTVRNFSVENFALTAKQVLLKDVEYLRGVKFSCVDYLNLVVPFGSVVYCDPPYFGCYDYASSFNHQVFWAWVRNISVHSYVYVSEYQAPSDFKQVWEGKRIETVASNRVKGTVCTERLFIWKRGLAK